MSPSSREINSPGSDTLRRSLLQIADQDYYQLTCEVSSIINRAGRSGKETIQNDFGDLRPVGLVAQFDPETRQLTHLHPVLKIEEVKGLHLSALYDKGALLVAAGYDFSQLFVLTPADPTAADTQQGTATHAYETKWTNQPALNHIDAQATLLPKNPDSQLIFVRSPIENNMTGLLYSMVTELASLLPPTSDDTELDAANRALSAIQTIKTALDAASK